MTALQYSEDAEIKSQWAVLTDWQGHLFIYWAVLDKPHSSILTDTFHELDLLLKMK